MTLLVNERVLAGGDAGAEVRLLAGVQAVKVRTGADPATVTRILIEEAYAPAKFSPLRWEPDLSLRGRLTDFDRKFKCLF